MNNERRNRIAQIINQLQDISQSLNDFASEESKPRKTLLSVLLKRAATNVDKIISNLSEIIK